MRGVRSLPRAGLLAGLVVALLAAGFLLLRGHEGPEPDLPDGFEREGGDTSTPTDLLRPGPPAGGGDTRPEAADVRARGRTPAFAGVHGVVVDERDRPLPGATVRLTSLEPQVFKGAAAAAGEGLARATTDGDGRFELALAEHRWVRVVASLAGRASVGTRVAGPGVFVRLVLPPAASLQVVVVDARDAPVAGARVAAFARQAVHVGETDEAGRARFDALAPGSVSIQVLGEGGRRARAGPVAVTSESTLAISVLLPDGVEVHGLVLDSETSLPVSGAEVHAAQPGLAFAAEPTGSDGAFGPVPAGAAGTRIALAVRAPGYAPRMLRILLPRSESPHRLPPILLQPAGDWAGSVVDAAGRPAAGVRVAWTAAGIAGREPPETRTDAEGGFTLPPPSPPAPGRRVVLTAEGPGGTAALAVRPGSRPTAKIVLVLGRGHTVTGRVVGPDGTPRRGVSVRLEPRWSEIPDRRRPGPHTARLLALGETARLALTTATDAEGWWRLAGVPDGVYDARLILDGATDFPDAPVRVEGSDVDAGVVRFGDGHALHGTAWDEAGRPLAGVEVTLREAEGHPRIRRASTDAEGAWRLEGVPAGSWRLAARRHDRALVRLDVEVPTTEPLDLELGHGARLSGRVVDAAGRPYRGVFTVHLEGPTPRGREPGTTFRDADGRFLLDGVLPGTWTVRAVTPRGDLGATRAPVEVRPGAAFDVTVVLGPGATLTGTLRRADGHAVVGGRIALTHEDRRATRTVSTGAGGAFRATGLDAGRWRLVAHGRGGAPVVRTVDVAVGEQHDLDLALGPVTSLEVTVRGEDGGVRVGAYVIVRATGSPTSRPETVPRTDTSGHVLLQDVPLGPVVIRARTRAGEAGRTEVEVAAGRALSVEVLVKKSESRSGN